METIIKILTTGIPLYVVVLIPIFHWIADYVMQKGSWAVAKSNNLIALFKHTFTYSVIITAGVGVLMYFNISCEDCLVCHIAYFWYITFITHTITDFFTSRKSSKEYKKGNFGTSIPRGMDFFVTLGFDQVLHALQLYSTYVILTM